MGSEQCSMPHHLARLYQHDLLGGFQSRWEDPSGGRDQTTDLLGVNSGQCPSILHGHTSAIYSVAFSPDGKSLATCGSSDQTVYLWEVNHGKLLITLQGHTGSVYSVAFSSDGRTLVGNANQTVCLWEVSSGKLLTTL